MYEQERFEQVGSLLDEPKEPSEKPPVYILDDFVDFLPVADDVEHPEECHVSDDTRKVIKLLTISLIHTYMQI